MFAGQAMEQADRYKYLGLVMHHNGSFMCAGESLQNAAQRALFALQAHRAELGILNPKLKCKLYDAVVKPVLSNGCEVWMPLISASGIHKLEKVQLNFLRRLLGIPHTAATKHIYAETGRLPDSTF